MKSFRYDTYNFADYDEDGVATWRDHIEAVMVNTGDKWSDIVGAVPPIDSNAYTTPFNCGMAGDGGPSFVVWTQEWIYFCAMYDGLEWANAMPRNPNPDWKPIHYGHG